MDKTRLKYFLDIGMTSVFLLCLGTGFAKFPLVTRYLGLKSAVIAPMTLIHDWSGVLFGALAVAHLALNWKWMVAMTKKVSGTKTTAKPTQKPVAEPVMAVRANAEESGSQ
jgi:hypothetical protein